MPHPICSQERLPVKSHFDPCTLYAVANYPAPYRSCTWSSFYRLHLRDSLYFRLLISGHQAKGLLWSREEDRRKDATNFNHHAKTALFAATWTVVLYDKWKRKAIFNQLTLGYCLASLTLSSTNFLSSIYTRFMSVNVF